MLGRPPDFCLPKLWASLVAFQKVVSGTNLAKNYPDTQTYCDIRSAVQRSGRRQGRRWIQCIRGIQARGEVG